MDPNQNNPNEQVLYEQPDQQASQDLAPVPTSSFPIKKILIIAGGVVIVLILLIVAFMYLTRPKEATGPVKLTYWGLWEQAELYEQIIAEYERDHPNVDIEYVYQEDMKSRPEGYFEYVRSRIKNGTGPDIVKFHNSWMSQMQPYLLPFPDEVATATGLRKGEDESEYYKVVVDDMVYEGFFYGIPLGIDVLALFTNDEMFQSGGYEVPTDWIPVIDVARALTVDEETTPGIDSSGIAFGTFDNVAHSADIVGLLFAQSGVNLVDLLSDDEEKSNKARNAAARALDYYTCFAKKTDICEIVWDSKMEDSTLAFAKGKVAMYLGYSWDIGVLRAVNPELQYSVHPVPALKGEGVVMDQTIASYWVEGVSRNTKHQKEAFEFLTYLSRKETLTKLYTERGKRGIIGSVFPRKDMAELMQKDPKYASFISQLDKARSTVFSSDTYDGAEITAFNNYLGDAVRTALGNSSSESAVDQLKNGMKEVVSRRSATAQ